MKSTLATVLLTLLVVCVFRLDSSVSPQAQVNAQTPQEADQDPLFHAMERFMEQRSARQQTPDRREQTDRDREPEMIGMLPDHPHPAEHRREQERHREAQREREHQLEQQRQRIENMHVAARHLEEAGLRDMAHQVHQRAKEQEHHLRKQRERARHHEQPHQEVLEILHQLRNEVRELKQEVRELRESVSNRPSVPEHEQKQNIR